MHRWLIIVAIAAAGWFVPAAAQTFSTTQPLLLPFTNSQGFGGSLLWQIVSDTPDTAYNVSWDVNYNIDGRYCNPTYELCIVPNPEYYSYTFTAGLDPTPQTLTFDLKPTFAGVYGTLVFSTSDPSAQLSLLGFSAIRRPDGVGLDVRFLPEPSTWAMMLLGFAVIGVALRRRHRTLYAL